MFFTIFTVVTVACLVMLAALLFYFATSMSLMLVSFAFTRHLKSQVWFATPGKWIAIFIAQFFIFLAIYYNYQGQAVPKTPEDLTIVICAFSFGLVWACNVYINAFKRNTLVNK